MTFGERLTQLRKENGYSTRNEFAELLKIPSTTLRNYETDVREPGHSFLVKISELFDVSVDYLLGITEERERTSPYNLKTSEMKHIEKYRNLDEIGQKTVDYILDSETTRTQNIKNAMERISAYSSQIADYKKRFPVFGESVSKKSELAAAHERTDIELTPEGKTNDDAIMDNDSEWE